MIFVNYFDVWGNEIDGFEVNDVSLHRISEVIPETELDVIQLLVDNDIVHSDVNLNDVDIQLSEYNAEITERKTGRPFGRIDFVE
jgi:hypothetical protein